MFYISKFNGNIDNWNLNNPTDNDDVFLHSPLENNPPKWYKNRINEGFDFNNVKKSSTTDKTNNIIKNVSVYMHEQGVEAAKKVFKGLSMNQIVPDVNMDLYYAVYKPDNKSMLKKIINAYCTLYGWDRSLNWLDVSDIIDMSDLFF